MNLFQLALDGIALGAAYALVAAGFVLTLNASRAVNFAHGELVMAGGFAAVLLASSLPLPSLLLLLLVALLLGLLGLLLAALAVLPLRRRPVVSVFASTIAAGIVLQNLATAWFGAQPRAGPSLAGGGLIEVGSEAIGQIQIGRQALAVILLAGAIYVGLHLLLARTQLGRRLRAAAQDPEMAEALGVPVTGMILVAFALSAALAGIAGMMLANSYFVTPTEGGALMLKAYIAATIGGWGRLHGAALGALIIGLFETVAAGLAGPVAAEAMLYAALLAILFFKPSGLFGEQAGSRA